LAEPQLQTGKNHGGGGRDRVWGGTGSGWGGGRGRRCAEWEKWEKNYVQKKKTEKGGKDRNFPHEDT